MQPVLYFEHVILEMRELFRASAKAFYHSYRLWFLLLRPAWSWLWRGVFGLLSPPQLYRRISPQRVERVGPFIGQVQNMSYWR